MNVQPLHNGQVPLQYSRPAAWLICKLRKVTPGRVHVDSRHPHQLPVLQDKRRRVWVCQGTALGHLVAVRSCTFYLSCVNHVADVAITWLPAPCQHLSSKSKWYCMYSQKLSQLKRPLFRRMVSTSGQAQLLPNLGSALVTCSLSKQLR